MAMLSSSSLVPLFIFLTLTHFHFLSHASPHHRHSLRVTVRQSTGGPASVELWCVAKNNAVDSALQSALDWACGPGGSDCGPIQQSGPCYDSGDIQRTASYAFNDYFLKHGMTEDSCNFDGTAALTSLNPSYGRCKFPSSVTVSNGSFTGSQTTVGIGPASADISGSNYNAGRWCWAFITTHLFYAITLII